MKKQQQIVFVAASAAILLAATGVQANTATVNGITWTYIVDNGKATLGLDSGASAAYGSNPAKGQAVSSSTAGAISIPSSLGGYPVTRIGKLAFYCCYRITSVIIPEGVTSIGEEAFYCGDVNPSTLRSVTIPNSVTSIEIRAFSGCRALRSVTIQGNGTRIGTSAFYDCTALTSATIQGNGTSIGTSAFSGCSALTSLTIGNGVTSIGTNAFSSCSSLASVAIPDSVQHIHEDAFLGCSALNANWDRVLSKLAIQGDEEPPDPRYELGTGVTDRTIATVTVTGDSTIDTFVLSDGKVFDAVLRVINVSSTPSTLTLPSGYVYERLKGTAPLTIPALSTNLLTITRTADRVFFVAREELEPAQ